MLLSPVDLVCRRMQVFFKPAGRLVLAAGFIGFGAEYGLYVINATLKPGPPWPLGGVPIDCLVGGVFLAVGLSLVLKRFDSTMALGFSALLLIYATIVDLPVLLRNVHAPNPWTSDFEVITLAGTLFRLRSVERHIGARSKRAIVDKFKFGTAWSSGELLRDLCDCH
jgi:hypothetical protein